jgi:hypothetical protein
MTTLNNDMMNPGTLSDLLKNTSETSVYTAKNGAKWMVEKPSAWPGYVASKLMADGSRSKTDVLMSPTKEGIAKFIEDREAMSTDLVLADQKKAGSGFLANVDRKTLMWGGGGVVAGALIVALIAYYMRRNAARY